MCYLFNININKTPQLIRSLVRADSVSQTFFVPSSQMINLLSTNNRYPPDKAAKCLIVMNDKCSFSLYCTRLLTSSSSARRSQPCRELLESQWLARNHFTVTRWRWLWPLLRPGATKMSSLRQLMCDGCIRGPMSHYLPTPWGYIIAKNSIYPALQQVFESLGVVRNFSLQLWGYNSQYLTFKPVIMFTHGTDIASAEWCTTAQ